MLTLGLDASTRVIGWAFAESGSLLDAGFFDISKQKTPKEKAYAFIQFLQQNPLETKFEQINLEAALLGFTGGKTSQQTIVKLIRWNAVFEYILSEHYGKPVNLVNVSSARKKVLGRARIKLDNGKNMPGKDFVKQELPKFCPEVVKFDKINKIGNPDRKNGDMYDGVVMALCYT